MVVARTPFQRLGFGSDDDAWRNVVAALHTLQTGVYAPSRVPGFPLLDALLLALVPLGAQAVVAASVLAQAFAAVLLLRLLQRERVRAPFAAALVFALAPGIWTAATQAMDYAFGLAAILACVAALRGGRIGLAGLLAGIAIGFRPSNGLIVPLGLLALVLDRRGGRAMAAFVLAALAAGALAYAPLLARPEMAHLQRHALAHVAHHAAAAAAPRLLWRTAVFLVGAPATLLGLGALVWWAARRRGTTSVRGPSGAVALELGAVLGWAALYLLIPYEPAYALPALPFALLLLARVSGARLFAAMVLAVAVEALVARHGKGLGVDPGLVPAELAWRRAQSRATERMLERARTPRTIQVVGQPYVHRLLARGGWRAASGAWAAFESRGVVLWAPGRQSGVAADLPDSAAWRAAGYRVVVDSTGAYAAARRARR